MRAPIVLARGEFFREGRRKKDTSLPSTRFSGRFWIVMSRNCSSLGAPVTLRSMAAAAVACMICSVILAQANPTSQPVADWQTAAGGPMAFEVALIKPSKPGAGRSANFPLDAGDAYLPGGPLPRAVFSADLHQFRLQTCARAGASQFHGCRFAEMVS